MWTSSNNEKDYKLRLEFNWKPGKHFENRRCCSRYPLTNDYTFARTNADQQEYKLFCPVQKGFDNPCPNIVQVVYGYQPLQDDHDRSQTCPDCTKEGYKMCSMCGDIPDPIRVWFGDICDECFAILEKKYWGASHCNYKNKDGTWCTNMRHFELEGYCQMHSNEKDRGELGDNDDTNNN